MIKTIEIINYLGKSSVFNMERPDKTGFFITDIKGLGPGKADISSSDNVAGDGGIFNSARTQIRNIVFSIMFDDRLDVEISRNAVYELFPLKQKILLIITTDTKKVYTDGYVESNESTVFSKETGCTISVMCMNPYFKAYGNSESHTLFGVQPLFEFPFSNESLTENLIEFGNIQKISTTSIIYNGDEPTGVVITLTNPEGSDIYHPVKLINIYNLTTRELMVIKGGVAMNETLVISSVKNNKYVIKKSNGITTPALNLLGRDFKWINLVKGTNTFMFSVEFSDEAEHNNPLCLNVEYQTLYGGV